MHVHISFLTPLIVLFSLWIIIPIQRTIAMWQHDKPWGPALAYVSTGF